MSVSLVIPVHNEAGNLGPLVTAAIEVLQALVRDYEIILVNDGSTDGTRQTIAAMRARWPQCRELTMPVHAVSATGVDHEDPDRRRVQNVPGRTAATGVCYHPGRG